MICNDCKNLDSDLCLKCIYHEDITDHYKRATKKELAERARKEIISEWISIEIPDSFREVYSQIIKVCSYIPDKLIFSTVHASENSLVASNGYLLVELSTDIPKPLVGKNIVTVEQARIGVYNKPYPDYETLFNKHMAEAETQQLSDIKNFEAGLFPRTRIFEFNELVFTNNEYFNLAMGYLTGDISVSYRPDNRHSFIVFTGGNGRAIMCSLQQE